MTTAQVAMTVLLSLPFAQAQTGADDWRLRPQRLLIAGADTVPRDVRSKRDQHFDDVYGPPPKGWVRSSPDWVELPGEIWTNSGMTIAVVQFTDYKIIRSAKAKIIYTEIALKAEQVLRDPSATVQPGKTLTVLLPGGYLRLPSGQIVHGDLGSGYFGIQPGHRYLAFMDYRKGTDYFEWGKSWDLTTRVAVPTYPLDIKLAANGKSRFAGMPEDNFITAVKELLSSGAK
jgi:hypothetical protein